ncbi:hypothetical protein MTO96_009808 [Rhipicephalus appendiculatus]
MDAAPKQRPANAFRFAGFPGRAVRTGCRGGCLQTTAPRSARRRRRRHSVERNFEDPGKLINLEVSNAERATAHSPRGPGKRGPMARRPRPRK